MPGDGLKVLTVSAADEGGGAEKIARALFRALRERGHGSWMAVGQRKSADPGVLRIPDAGWREALSGLLAPLGGARGSERLRRRVQRLSNPEVLFDQWRGREPFHYAGTRKLLDLPPERPEVLHCHNLHGGYFDLRALADFSRDLPVALTLHDEWSYTGHCAYTLGCERWESGCGHCPHLDVYPAIRRDASVANWAAKRDIFARARLYVATPSNWLMTRVRKSILAPALADARVIPNGIDLTTFRPGDQGAARRRLSIPEDALVLLFTANRARISHFKDYATVRAAALMVAQSLPQRRVMLLAVGDSGPAEKVGDTEIRFVPYQSDEAAVAAYYQAADIYLHAAHADNFPTTVLEASACGVPVVVTAVGGIPEQVASLDHPGVPEGGWPRQDPGTATGVLVDHGDSAAMARAAVLLLEAPELRARLAGNAAARARREWSETRMVADYLEWYDRIMEMSRQHRGQVC